MFTRVNCFQISHQATISIPFRSAGRHSRFFLWWFGLCFRCLGHAPILGCAVRGVQNDHYVLLVWPMMPLHIVLEACQQTGWQSACQTCVGAKAKEGYSPLVAVMWKKRTVHVLNFAASKVWSCTMRCLNPWTINNLQRFVIHIQ